jgi:hypothetical protein
LKRRRRPSQDEKDEGGDNSPFKMCPFFPSLGRQQQQQLHQLCIALLPVAYAKQFARSLR